jgi:hypothetical protein
VLLGADPDDLEQLAAAHDACAAFLGRVRTRLRAADRSAWSGRDGSRWWSELDRSLVPSIVAAGNASAASARLVRSQAREQRRVSLPDPSTTTVRIDHRGDGRWVGRTGPADADVIVVLVPGVGTDLAEVGRLTADAGRLWATTVAHASADSAMGGSATGRIAVLSWLGYDPPDNVVVGLDPRSALVGAPRLAQDGSALRASGADTVVVVGHSYGAVVASRAVSSGMAADAVVLLGSPGLGRAATGGITGHGTGQPAMDLWVAAAPHDPIPLIGRSGLVHGALPGRDVRTLPTSLPGHGAYLRDPVLLDALAAMVVLPAVAGGDAATGPDQPVPSTPRRSARGAPATSPEDPWDSASPRTTASPRSSWTTPRSTR